MARVGGRVTSVPVRRIKEVSGATLAKDAEGRSQQRNLDNLISQEEKGMRTPVLSRLVAGVMCIACLGLVGAGVK